MAPAAPYAEESPADAVGRQGWPNSIAHGATQA